MLRSLHLHHIFIPHLCFHVLVHIEEFQTLFRHITHSHFAHFLNENHEIWSSAASTHEAGFTCMGATRITARSLSLLCCTKQCSESVFTYFPVYKTIMFISIYALQLQWHLAQPGLPLSHSESATIS
jgi:hypothetical protein